MRTLINTLLTLSSLALHAQSTDAASRRDRLYKE